MVKQTPDNSSFPTTLEYRMNKLYLLRSNVNDINLVIVYEVIIVDKTIGYENYRRIIVCNP